MKQLGWILGALVTASCSFPRPADVPGDASPGTSCQLLAVEPSIANTDDPITLEGTFDDPVMVNFPGGAAVAATVLGPHRASVRVPATATTGELTVTTCGATIGSLPFRRASFSLGIGPFAANFEQTSGARQFPSLVTPRDSHTSALIGRYLYLVGGVGPNGSLNSVEQAMVNADGTLGQFAIVRSTLVMPRRAHTSRLIGRRLYVIGGFSDAPLGGIEHATIESDSSLGPFTTAQDTKLVDARGGHASVVVGNYLYVLGGLSTTTLNTVERAMISPDGSIGPFAALPGVRLATARHGHTATVIGNSLYVVGGAGANGALKDVERALIDADGSIGSFAVVSGATLAVARSGHTAEMLGNHLYVIFGSARGELSLNSIERAPFDVDGTLGSFEDVTPSNTTALESRGHTTTVIGDYLYVFGGSDNFGSRRAGQRAALNAGGALGMFSTVLSITQASARAGHTATVIGSYLYLIGGTTPGTGGSTGIERATINADGSLGLFGGVPGIALTTPRRHHATAVVGNYLYVLGGDDSGSVERAAILADGSLGPFSQVIGASLRVPRFYHTIAALRDQLYVFGDSNGSLLSSIEGATMNADGSLSPFTIIANITLRVERVQHASAVIGDYLYIIGGMSPDSLELSSVERADIHNGLTSFDIVPGVTITATRGLTAAVVGQSLYVLGGSPSIAERATVTGGSLGPFGPSSGGELTTRRFFPATVVLKNHVYVLGGIFGRAEVNSVESAQLQ